MHTYSIRITRVQPGHYNYSVSGYRLRGTGTVDFFDAGERDPATGSRWFYMVHTGELSETTEALIRLFLEAKTLPFNDFPSLGIEGHDCLQFSL